MTAILGIDPGLSGAFAVFDSKLGAILRLSDTPVHEIRGKRHIDPQSLAIILDSWTLDRKLDLAIIEEVGAMPRQGVSSTFKFGTCYGVALGLCAALFIPVRTVRPATWKKAMGLTNDKDHARQMASRMFPRDAEKFSRVKDDGRAEAVLLACYGARSS